MSAATFPQGGLPGLVCGQDAPCYHLLPVGDLGADSAGDALGHAPHDILGESMAVRSLPWADSAMVHLTWQGLPRGGRKGEGEILHLPAVCSPCS